MDKGKDKKQTTAMNIFRKIFGRNHDAEEPGRMTLKEAFTAKYPECLCQNKYEAPPAIGGKRLKSVSVQF